MKFIEQCIPLSSWSPPRPLSCNRLVGNMYISIVSHSFLSWQKDIHSLVWIPHSHITCEIFIQLWPDRWPQSKLNMKSIPRAGYGGLFSNKDGSTTEGCALFYRTARYTSVNQKTLSMKQLMASILNGESSTHDQLRPVLQSSERLQDILQKVCSYLLPPLLPQSYCYWTANLLCQQIIDIFCNILDDDFMCIPCSLVCWKWVLVHLLLTLT